MLKYVIAALVVITGAVVVTTEVEARPQLHGSYAAGRIAS